jgi:hypothetical protein
MDAEFLKELRPLRKNFSEFDDKCSLFSLLPLIKKLSPEAKIILLIETQRNCSQWHLLQYLPHTALILVMQVTLICPFGISISVCTYYITFGAQFIIVWTSMSAWAAEFWFLKLHYTDH